MLKIKGVMFHITPKMIKDNNERIATAPNETKTLTLHKNFMDCFSGLHKFPKHKNLSTTVKFFIKTASVFGVK